MFWSITPHGLGWIGRKLARIKIDQINSAHFGPQPERISPKWVGLTHLSTLLLLLAASLVEFTLHECTFLFFIMSLMNMLIWNCNEAASQSFLRSLKDLLCRYKQVLFGLLESRCSGDHANKICNQIGYDH